MTTAINTTLSQIAAMPVADQIELLHEAWNRLLDSGWEPDLSESQRAAFDRRLDDLDAYPQKSVSLEAMLQRVRRER